MTQRAPREPRARNECCCTFTLRTLNAWWLNAWWDWFSGYAELRVSTFTVTLHRIHWLLADDRFEFRLLLTKGVEEAESRND